MHPSIIQKAANPVFSISPNSSHECHLDFSTPNISAPFLLVEA